MKIIGLKKHPEYKDRAITYIQNKWANESSMDVYKDCIEHSIISESKLPLWYILLDSEEIIGCAGLITNDFISRMDLWPWICALYIEERYRGQSLGKKMIFHAINDAAEAGFEKVYLCTDHVGYYEKFGFNYIGDGYHPWGQTSRIYATNSKD